MNLAYHVYIFCSEVCVTSQVLYIQHSVPAGVP